MQTPLVPGAPHPHRMRWIAALYFAQGLPFAIINSVFSVYLAYTGVSLREQGFARLLQLPWTFKVAWSPWVDRWGTPHHWICACLLSIAGLLGLAGFAEMSGSLRWGVPMACLLLLITLASATQDVAIDGYFVRLIKPSETGIGNGLRVSAYRVALIVGGGGSIMLAAQLAWSTLFFGLAAVCVGLALLLSQAPQIPRAPAHSWREWTASLGLWLRRPGSLHAFLFILLYKLGDVALAPMIQPFWLARGMSLTELGFASTTLGVGASIAGAMAGGWYTGKKGVYTALWQLGLLQAVSNLGYAMVSALGGGKLALFSASFAEHFSGGLGSAAELVLLTQLCDREHAATQYAALTCLFSATRVLVGSQSGIAVEFMGFTPFFFLTFALSFVCFLFLPGVKRRLRC